MADLTMTYGTAKNLSANGFTRAGYTFAGWATSAAGNVVYANGASVSNLTSTAGATVNLYAAWTLSTPTGVTATSDLTAGVTVSWTASAAATSYDIWRSTNDVSQATKLGTATTASYSDTSASPGVLYTYWVSVVNQDGTSEKSSPATGVRKLTAPTGLTVVANGNARVFSWTPVTGATGYNVYRSTSDDSSTATLVASVNAETYQEVPEKAGKNYYFWIKAVGASGNGNSDLSVSQMCYRPLSAPTITSAVTVRGGGTTVSYKSVQDAVSYRLYYNGLQDTKKGGNFYVQWMQWQSYRIEICAVGENGIEGPRSATSTLYHQP